MDEKLSVKSTHSVAFDVTREARTRKWDYTFRATAFDEVLEIVAVSEQTAKRYTTAYISADNQSVSVSRAGESLRLNQPLEGADIMLIAEFVKRQSRKIHESKEDIE